MTADIPAAVPSPSQQLRVIPLGGLGEFGMNLMIYEFGESIILADCGMTFPDPSTLGVDVIIPDMTYLFERAGNVAAIFLTHGHEDHIGAVPFLVEKVPAPIYGTPLTLGFVRDKLDELGIQDVQLRELLPRERVRAGEFDVEAIHVTHSIVDAVALAITTPIGVVIHTGDFKIDQTPVAGATTDLGRLAYYGELGVLLLASDSTNAHIAGFSSSERTVGGALERIMSKAPGRVIVTTFASHIHRIQQIVNQAQKLGRRVYFVGRSVVDNVETAEKLGHLRISREVRGNMQRPEDEQASRVVIITTGTQGEPTSALARIALDEHKAVSLEKGDTVIISARTIPGNERAVSNVIDHLYMRGARVFYDETRDIHVSGHGFAEELKTMMLLTQPKFFIPMHGRLRNLVHHADLAQSIGIPSGNVFVMTNGSVVELTQEKGRILEEKVPSGRVFIDHQSGEVAEVVVRDRKHLAEDGFVIVVAAVDMNSGRLAREMEIITRGVLHVDANPEMLAEVRELLNGIFVESGREELRDAELVQEKMRSVLKRYFRKKLERRPMILPVVWEM